MPILLCIMLMKMIWAIVFLLLPFGKSCFILQLSPLPIYYLSNKTQKKSIGGMT